MGGGGRRIWRGAWRVVGGTDGPGRRALPAGELLHPAPLVAVIVLAVNDHLLKGSGLVPGWLTGKLSDVAGYFFFPLLLTALGDTIARTFARWFGLRQLDFSLRWWKAWVALALTAGIALGLELSPAIGGVIVSFLRTLGFSAGTTRDPLDLLALCSLVPAAWIFRAELARVPLGRMEVLERARITKPEAVREALADCRAAARFPEHVDLVVPPLSRWLRGDGAAASELLLALGRLRR